MTSAERLERIGALQRQLAELKSFMLDAQQRVAEVLCAAGENSHEAVLPLIAEESQKQGKTSQGGLNGDDHGQL